MHRKENLTVNYPSASFQPTDWLRFVYLDPFSKKWEKLNLTDDDLSCLEIAVMLSGESCPVIKATNGLRKVRFSPRSSNRGKRESFRVCFCLFPDHGVALMVTVFGKNEKSNLHAEDRAVIAQMIARTQEAFAQGKI